jgi:phosphoglycolate phosphatase
LKYPSKAEMVSEIVSDDKKKYTCLVGDSNDDLNAAEKNDIDFIFCSYGYGVLNGYAGKEISSFIEILEKI